MRSNNRHNRRHDATRAAAAALRPEQDARDIDRACKGKGMAATKGQTRSQGRALTRYRRDLGFEGFKSYTPALCVRPMKTWVRI